ncbi:hypothetical protein SAG0136_10045 [Streptococcus agalactiae LMG 14747]|uniref:Uncharacterized protein n=1 Tax=Streptococcus agalactiae LMG 14747 TaxID=1154860 RepID=V6Z7C1_STRAG|nr:hypothetical protein SAG0136_10045 [Streptococcus agalactiae LMG 14747]
MKKAGLAIKYLLALFPSVVTLTMIVVGIISFPVSLISNLDLVSSEIIIIVLMLICGVRFFRSGISKQWQVLYWFTSILTIFLFFVWSKRAILIQPLQITVPLVLFEKNLQNLRKYINDNISAFFWLNVYDSIFICLNFLVGTNKHISENIQKILVPLNIPISYADAVLGAFFLFFWLLLAPVFRSWFGIHFFRKQNPISLPADRVLWGTYLLGYFLSLAILTIYINTYFTISQINSNPIFIMLVYTIYLSSNVFLWNPVYVSLINLGENKDKGTSKNSLNFPKMR